MISFALWYMLLGCWMALGLSFFSRTKRGVVMDWKLAVFIALAWPLPLLWGMAQVFAEEEPEPPGEESLHG